MAKLPFMQFYPADYLRDTRGLPNFVKGIWTDILCYLWDAKKRGQQTRTMEDWMSACGSNPTEFPLAISTLEMRQICDVVLKENLVTFTSRRMIRDEKNRKQVRARVTKCREKKAELGALRNASVTPSVTPLKRSCNGDISEFIYQSSEAISGEEKKEKIYVGLTPDDANGSAPASLWKEAEELLAFLNSKTGKHFQARHPNKAPTKALQSVHVLLKKGYDATTIRQVIANRWLKWGNDDRMQEFLRPETLFRISKFENYVGELGKGQLHASL